MFFFPNPATYTYFQFVLQEDNYLLAGNKVFFNCTEYAQQLTSLSNQTISYFFYIF